MQRKTLGPCLRRGDEWVERDEQTKSIVYMR